MSDVTIHEGSARLCYWSMAVWICEKAYVMTNDWRIRRRSCRFYTPRNFHGTPRISWTLVTEWHSQRSFKFLFQFQLTNTVEFVESSSSFKCCLGSDKYRSFNAVFGKKIGRIASHEVVTIQLIKSKCFSFLCYGLEACPLRKSHYNSINCIINSTFRKIFNTRSQ